MDNKEPQAQVSRSDGLVRLVPAKLDRQLLRSGLSKTALADTALVSRNTVISAFHGEPIRNYSACAIAKVLGIDVIELLPSSDKHDLGSLPEPPIGGEWDVVQHLGPWLTASNGLQFRVCRLQHRYLASSLGRGKWYDLLHLSNQEREGLRDYLIRHPTVSRKIGPHPHLSDTLNTMPGAKPDAWWVVDRWFEGEALKRRIDDGEFPLHAVPRLMTEIARGLAALHAAQVVFRELAPSRVYLHQGDGRVILTDFELAKLLAEAPTVSNDWPDDPYRAPEVEDGATNVRADFYSWGRILLHVATGSLPPKGEDAEALSRAPLPKAVWRLAADCLSPVRTDRPKDIGQILRIVERWAIP